MIAIGNEWEDGEVPNTLDTRIRLGTTIEVVSFRVQCLCFRHEPRDSRGMVGRIGDEEC